MIILSVVMVALFRYLCPKSKSPEHKFRACQLQSGDGAGELLAWDFRLSALPAAKAPVWIRVS